MTPDLAACPAWRMPVAAAVILFGVSAGAMPTMLSAASIEVPVSLDYRIVEEALEQQVFTGADRSAEVFADSTRCNTLVMFNPTVTGGEDHRLRLVTEMRAKFGVPAAGRCLFSGDFAGIVETAQTAHVQPGAQVIGFRIVESRLLKAEDGKDALPGFMQRWIRDYVHPLLDSVLIDLGPAVSGIEELIGMVLEDAGAGATARPTQGPPWPVNLAGVRLAPEVMVATLSLTVPDAPPHPAPQDQAPLTDAELAIWDANWQAWDAFATWTIKTLAITAGPDLSRALGETLLEARYELRDALAMDDRARDPVRDLFLSTWARLAPMLHDSDLPVPGGQALRFAVFVGAMDALRTLDELAPHLGLSISQDALRSLARMLVPAVSDYDLRYDTSVDADLRELLGLGPALEDTLVPSGPGEGLPGWLINRLISSAHAAQIDARLVQRLNTWVPRRPEIDSYLQTMARLLDAISDGEHENAKVPSEFLAIYDPLLRATAWQESCWRQYVERNGEIETIRSSAGSVGLMQVNVHVWRGIYDVDQILGNVGYNARAGNEILVHYLVDYAIRRKEHEVTGDTDNLARAAYAMYNGGPGHIRRYRQENTSAFLKKIDNAFWAKYQAIQREGPLAVKACLAGG